MRPDIPSWCAVAAGGACGTLVRALLDSYAAGGTTIGVFHWSTLCVNLCGALFLGIVAALYAPGGLISTDTPQGNCPKLFLTTGFAGAFTTYSTMVLATVTSAASPSQILYSLLQSLLMLCAGVACAGLGWGSARSITRRMQVRHLRAAEHSTPVQSVRDTPNTQDPADEGQVRP